MLKVSIAWSYTQQILFNNDCYDASWQSVRLSNIINACVLIAYKNLINPKLKINYLCLPMHIDNQLKNCDVTIINPTHD